MVTGPSVHHAVDCASNRCTILVVGPDNGVKAALASHDVRFTGAVPRLGRAESRLPLSCDVLVVVLSGVSQEVLSWVLGSWHELGGPELVFMTPSDSLHPAAAALTAVGARYVVADNDAATWLHENSTALAEFARARRAMERALLRRPPPTSPDGECHTRVGVGLADAEQRFRTTYLEALMSTSATRRQAAERARVPYRTLSHMLEKLGIPTRRSPTG